MSTGSRFDKFLNSVSLTTADREDAKKKYDGVAGKLHSHYYTSAYNGSTKLLIGSYGKRTPVRPPRDVDVLFIMPDSLFTRYNSYVGNGQSALLQDVRAVLLQKYWNTKVRGDGQVVVVPFSDGHTVELLPGWTLEGKFIVPNTHDGGHWQIVDHKAEIANIESSDSRSNGNTRALIKMMKTWQSECNVPIKSLALELRSVNFLKKWEHYNKSSTYYDWMVRDFLAELPEYKNGTCKVPGTDEVYNYGDAWASRAETAHARAVKACGYEASDKHVDAAIEWRKIFGTKYEL